jgi:hypothetical protein
MGLEMVALFNTILDGITRLERNETQPVAPAWARAMVGAALDDYRHVRDQGKNVEVEVPAAVSGSDVETDGKRRKNARAKSATNKHPAVSPRP